MSLILREFRNSDLQHLAKLEADYYREVDTSEEYSESKFISEVFEAKNSPNHRIFVAQAEDEIAGFIWLQEYEENEGRLGYITNIHVVKKYRNRGIGKRLLRFAEDYFRRKGAVKLQLEVVDTNTPAISLYQKNGFKQVVYSQKLDDSTPAGDYWEKTLT
jgi:ribosomal protein S18 acetylase RimI-like enzyme